MLRALACATLILPPRRRVLLRTRMDLITSYEENHSGISRVPQASPPRTLNTGSGEKYFQKPRADMYYDLSGPDGPVADSDEGYRMSNDEIDEENKG